MFTCQPFLVSYNFHNHPLYPFTHILYTCICSPSPLPLPQIQCRDCRKESNTLFHVVGLKCTLCGSFNTVRCGSEELPEDNDDDHALEGVPARALELFMQLLQRGRGRGRNLVGDSRAC